MRFGRDADESAVGLSLLQFSILFTQANKQSLQFGMCKEAWIQSDPTLNADLATCDEALPLERVEHPLHRKELRVNQTRKLRRKRFADESQRRQHLRAQSCPEDLVLRLDGHARTYHVNVVLLPLVCGAQECAEIKMIVLGAGMPDVKDDTQPVLTATDNFFQD